MYAIINQTSEISSRLARGSNARLEWEGDTLTKYPNDLGHVEWEAKILRQLEDRGFDRAPKLYSYNDCSLTMSTINSAGTLMDYFLLYASNPAKYFSDMQDIWEAATEVIEDFHEQGWVHGDLHALNILFEQEDKDWVAYLIDFSSTYHKEELEDFCYEQDLIPEEVYTPEDDLQFLEEYILDNYPGDPQEVYDIIS
jgi:tRNA A-37 threonylcarbamoyl transferase component Bud32